MARGGLGGAQRRVVSSDAEGDVDITSLISLHKTATHKKIKKKITHQRTHPPAQANPPTNAFARTHTTA